MNILSDYSEDEKAAYLGAIASIATADRSATEEEILYLETLAESAQISEERREIILEAAQSEMSDDDLKRCLDVLKSSDLRFNLVSDVIAFAEADKNYSEDEKQNVAGIAEYLGVNNEQLSLLNQFTKNAVSEVPNHAESIETNQSLPSNFLDNLGIGDKLKKAGINSGTLLKGALAILGPIIIAKLLNRKSSTGGGGLGGALGGMFGGNRGQSGGGIGDLLGGILGGGNSSSTTAQSGGDGLGDVLGGLFGKGGGGMLGGMFGGGQKGGGFGNAGNLLGRILGGR